MWSVLNMALFTVALIDCMHWILKPKIPKCLRRCWRHFRSTLHQKSWSICFRSKIFSIKCFFSGQTSPDLKRRPRFEEKNIVSYFCFDLLTLFLMLRFKNLEWKGKEKWFWVNWDKTKVKFQKHSLTIVTDVTSGRVIENQWDYGFTKNIATA